MSVIPSIKCIGGRIEYPLKHKDNETHKLYILSCIVDAVGYKPLALSTTMSSTSSAGIDTFPSFGADATAYFVGDTEPFLTKGPIVSFDRKFATVPSSRTERDIAFNFTFPERRAYEDNTSSNIESKNRAFAANVNAQPSLGQLISPGKTFETLAVFEYSYAYRSDSGVGYQTDLPFNITLSEDVVSRQETSGPTTFYNYYYQPAADYLNTLIDEITVGSSVFNATNPTRTNYEDNYVDQTFIVADSRVNRYMGNIFEKKVIKVLAK